MHSCKDKAWHTASNMRQHPLCHIVYCAPSQQLLPALRASSTHLMKSTASGAMMLRYLASSVLGRLMSGNLSPANLLFFRNKMSCCRHNGPAGWHEDKQICQLTTWHSTSRATECPARYAVLANLQDRFCRMIRMAVRTMLLHHGPSWFVLRLPHSHSPSIFCTMYSWSMSLSPGKSGWPSLSSPMMHLNTTRSVQGCGSVSETNSHVSSRKLQLMCRIQMVQNYRHSSHNVAPRAATNQAGAATSSICAHCVPAIPASPQSPPVPLQPLLPHSPDGPDVHLLAVV